MQARIVKRSCGLVVLLCMLVVFSGCQKRTVSDYMQEFAEIVAEYGYEAAWKPLRDSEHTVAVPIFDETVWHVFRIGEEDLFVYFDSSNRAKQLAEQFCADPAFGRAVAYRMRYIVMYQGADEHMQMLLTALESA